MTFNALAIIQNTREISKTHFSRENIGRYCHRSENWKEHRLCTPKQRKGPNLGKWELELTTHTPKDNFGFQINHKKQKQVEHQASEYIQSHFWFVVFPVPQKETRLMLESRIISSVSLYPSSGPSPNWLGLFSPKDKIKESDLWIVNELYKQPLTQLEFENLNRLIFLNA